MENLLDKNQREMSKNFHRDHFLGDTKRCNKFFEWNTFFRRNINRFVEMYFGLTLHLFQHIILYLMNLYPSICIIASRAASKSFLIAIFACAKAILYPESMIVIASATRGQSKLIITEKIQNELMQRSPNLRREIERIKDNTNEVIVYFRNGSTIRIVTAGETARGNRATIIIYEEARQILKNIIDTILSPFLIVRQAPYMSNPIYEDIYDEPTEVYISSNWWRTHWMWKQMINTASDMVVRNRACFMAMDYSITLKHRIKTRDYLVREKRKLDPISWAIEYENLAPAENTSAYFTYDIIEPNQNLKKAFYPIRNTDYSHRIKNKYAIPKQDGEIRIISADIAMINKAGNDNSSYSCLRLLPEMVNYRKNSESTMIEYRVQIPYLEAHKGMETTKQAIRIKQLFHDFDADYLVLDTRNAGVSVGDALMRVLYDDERDVEYKPWTYMNDDVLASRIINPNALPVIYSITASQRLNSEIAQNMREMLVANRVDFLISNTDAPEEIQKFAPDYLTTADPELQMFYEKPYLESACLVSEMLGLEYEKLEQTGVIKIKEVGSATKDRYTSVSYGCFFCDKLSRDLVKYDETEAIRNAPSCVTAISF